MIFNPSRITRAAEIYCESWRHPRPYENGCQYFGNKLREVFCKLWEVLCKLWEVFYKLWEILAAYKMAYRVVMSGLKSSRTEL